jgi:hypothetical protein
VTRRYFESRSDSQYLELLIDFFKQDGWSVTSIAGLGAHLETSRGDFRYFVSMKVSSEGRRDRLMALLSQATLQA